MFMVFAPLVPIQHILAITNVQELRHQEIGPDCAILINTTLYSLNAIYVMIAKINTETASSILPH